MQKILLTLIICVVFQTMVCGQTKETYYNNAFQLYDQKKYNDALNEIEKALKFQPLNSGFLLLKADILIGKEEYRKAYDVYSEIINEYPTEPVAYNQRGLLLKGLLQTEAAIKDFTKAISYEKTDSLRLSFFLNRGAAKIDMRDFKGAYDDFSSALKIDSLDIGTLNNIATVCDEVGRGNETLRYLYKIIEIDSTYIGAYANIGFKYQEMGDYTTAVSFYDKVLALNPNEALGYSNRAFNLYKLGEYKKALKDINSSIKLYNTNPYAYKVRALIHLAQNNNAKACSDIKEGLRLGFTQLYGSELETLQAKHCK